MSQEASRTDLQSQSRQLMDGPLKHVRAAALAAALVPLGSVLAAPTTAQGNCQSAGVICGTVFTDSNGNGFQDVDEPGVPNVPVQIVCTGSGCPTPNDVIPLTTDANGFFTTIDHLNPFLTYTVTVPIPTGFQASPQGAGSAGAPDSSGLFSVATGMVALGSSTDFGFAPVSTASSCPAGTTTANSSLITHLGAAGPGNFAVLSLGDVGSVININMATIQGNVGLPNTGTLKESAPSSVFGDLIIGSATNTAGVKGRHGAIVIDDALLAQAVSDAENAAAFFASLPATPAVQAQFPANGQITSSLTITGTAGLNVVNLSTFRLDNGSGALTLTGPAGAAFVINVYGNFDLHTGNIQVAGGLGPLDVVYNIINPKATVKTMVPTTAVGILLAPDNAINAMDSATFTGEVIGAFQKTIVLMSGSNVVNPCQP